MSPVNADDLPADVRKKLGLPPKGRSKPRLSRAGVGDAVPCRCRCRCGEMFDRYDKAEKHAREYGHTRIEVLI